MVVNYGTTTEGYITSERHMIANTKVVTESSYNSGYEFVVNGVTYKGNSRQNKLSIGSLIEIEYCKHYPKFNRVKR
ncbi:MAG: hypothetical protein HC817_07930 [Saprospiraceae bacterium]|nr:hypothetical protein [Saprospiraceae bacterium]